MMTRRLLLTLLAGAMARSSVVPVRAQEWPQKRIRVVVPFSPGGLTDDIARLIGQRLSESLGQPFVIENMAGAGGAIAAAMVARAPADGYILLVGSLPQIAIVPAIEKVSYDPVKSFAPISNVASAPFVLMVNRSVPAKTLKEFVDYARTRPNQLTYASAGVGSLTHLSMALFLKRAGIEMIHVPYKGGVPALTDLVGGQVTSYFGTRADALQQFESGTIRLLAVSDERRSAQFLDVPTVAESGYPGFRTVTWNGLMAPAGAPQAIIDRLAGAIQHIAKDHAFIQNLTNIGSDPIGDRPQEFAATIAADVPLWAEAVRVAGVKRQ
jgi:tripartite-type tricarboxylate transporter receptor subunit TctC